MAAVVGFGDLELCQGNGGSFSWTLKFLALLSIFYSIRALLLLFTCLAMGLGRAIKLHTDESLKLGENKNTIISIHCFNLLH